MDNPGPSPSTVDSITPTRRRPSRGNQSTFTLLGLVLLVAWFWLWAQSFIEFQFATLRTWLPVWNYMGLDLMHCVFAVRVMFSGQDPYVVDAGDFRGAFTAPPIVLALFTWTWFFNAYYATMVWTGVIAATITWAVEMCRRVRAALGLSVPALPLAVALMLWSTPVLFAMERGNLDVWVLLTLFLALPLLQRPSLRNEVLAGAVLAIGAWAKIYPGLLVFALPALGRWRAAVTLAVMIVLIGVVPFNATRGFFRNSSRGDTQDRVAPLREVVDWVRKPTFEKFPPHRRILVERAGHSLVTYWPVLFGTTPLGSVPGFLGAAVILAAILLYGTYEVRRSPRRDELMFPYLLWVIGVGTYGLPVSYDYNLFFLLLLVLALWRWRDPWWLHLSLVAVLVWWQPFELPHPFTMWTFIYLKFFSLIPVTVLLVRRAREKPQPGFEVVEPPVAAGTAAVIQT